MNSNEDFIISRKAISQKKEVMLREKKADEEKKQVLRSERVGAAAWKVARHMTCTII